MSLDAEQQVQRLEEALSDDDRALLDSLADGIAKRRLTPAAVFFLESVKPLGWIGSQLLLFLRPIVAVVWHDPVRWDRLQTILEKRGSVELLLRRLEARY
ncbi:MAG: hypothetical protein H6709_05335 [Kofleriaceae bacterium]|nr:hypothetical protein [Myxococcales bacterium]MCB9559884.1 hypothetical protein [Kofleriaceae bacterium]MCB9571496.1 hypothetical protein [Kofleriaceae bacterium]